VEKMNVGGKQKQSGKKHYYLSIESNFESYFIACIKQRGPINLWSKFNILILFIKIFGTPN